MEISLIVKVTNKPEMVTRVALGKTLPSRMTMSLEMVLAA